MNNALTVSGLTKTYKDFVLDNVSFSVPSGSIVGLIGENGAGKSTTINAALGLIHKEAGHVSVLGKDELDNETKEQIGVVFDGSNYPEILSPKKINQIMKNIYGSWDEQAYFRLLKQFSLPLDKQIKQFSKGMKMKLATVILLSVKAVIQIQVIWVTAKLAFREKGGIIYANAIWVARQIFTAAKRETQKHFHSRV